MANKDLNKEIGELINVDALSEAEKITGVSYKDDKTTGMIGFRMHIEKCKKMAELMAESGDTCFSESEEDYLTKVKSFGFKSIGVFPFMNDEGIEERFHVLFHYEFSILLKFDTFTWGDDGSWAKSGKEVPSPSVNGGNFYYNWSPNTDKYPYSVTSSGGFVSHGGREFSYNFDKNLEPIKLPKNLLDKKPEWNLDENEDWEKFNVKRTKWEKKCKAFFANKECKNIYAGNHDCREAVNYNIQNLLKHGTFLKKWKEQPSLWLLTRDDYRGKEYGSYDVKELNALKIAKFPQEVQDLIKGEY